MPDTLSVAAYDRSGTLLTTLDEAHNRTYQDQRSDTGTWSLELQNDDPAAQLIPERSIVRYSINGTPRYSGVVEAIKRKAIDPGEEEAQIATLSGRGALAIWEEAVIYPQGGVGALPVTDTRLFSYATPGFDTSGWPNPVALKQQAFSADPYSGAPANWPAPLAYWIWGVGGAAPFPVGDCYFVETFPLANEATVRIFASADDGMQVYIDGALLMSDEQAYLWYQTKQADVFLPAGLHTIAIKGTNVARPSTPATNVAAVIACGFVVNGDGTLGAELFTTDSGWACMPYPASGLPPAPTPGWIINLLLAEAQARGALSGVSLTFSDIVDSDGNTWDEAGAFAWTIGTDYLTALKAMASTWIDIDMSPGALQLNAYNARGQGQATVLAPGVNLTSLTFDGIS